MCDNPGRKEQLVGYVYDELDPRERQAFEAHLAVCPSCRLEAAGLQATRTHLSAWAVPDAREAIQPPVVSTRRPMLPAMGLAAAAALVLGVSAALANLEIRVGTDGVTMRTGWAAAPPTASAPAVAEAAVSPAEPAGDEWKIELARLQARLAELEDGLASRLVAGAQAAGTQRMSDADLLRRVRDIVTQSESRQEREIMLRVSHVMREFERQRRNDLALIQQGMNQYHGMTNAEIAQQRETLNQLVRVRQERE